MPTAPCAKGRAMRRKLVGTPSPTSSTGAVHRSDHGEVRGTDAGDAVRHAVVPSRPRSQDPNDGHLVSDAATGRTTELKVHLRFARNHGWTEDELVEALLQLLGYVGAPLVREALLVAKETFAEMRAENPVTS